MRLFELAAQATAELAASYLAAGFVHGVLNSDNINITGETFDYGPWRFTPEWDPAFTAAYFDHYGLYAFGRQPEAIHWDLAQLGGCLSLVADGPRLSDILASWSDRFEAALTDALCRRLGVARDCRRLPPLCWRRSPRAKRPSIASSSIGAAARDPGVELYPSSTFRALAKALEGRTRDRAHPYWSDPGPCSMQIDEVEAIWSAIAERDDWQPFEDKVRAIRRMGEAMEQDAQAG